MGDENMCELLDHNLVVSPLKETTASLSRTPKGKIAYDRTPLTSILPTSFDSRSGFLLSDGVVNRKPGVLIENSFKPDLLSEPSVDPNVSLPINRSNLGINLQLKPTERKRNLLTWQEELLLMRNTPQMEETTPVYNISSHTILQLFEMKEKHRLSVASDFKKKIEDFEEASRKRAEEECLRKKKELEERLVPKTESHIDVELTIQRLQEEARIRRIEKENQIERKLKEMHYLQEKEKQEDQKRKILESQMTEALNRKQICTEKMVASEKRLGEGISKCLERESFVSANQMRIVRLKELKNQFETLSREAIKDDPLAIAVRCEGIAKQFEETINALILDISKHNDSIKDREAAKKQQETAQASIQPTSAPQVPAQQQPAASKPSLESKPIEPKVEAKDEGLSDVHKDDLSLYNQVMAELREYEAKATIFTSNTTLKTLRFEFQKAAVQPLNEISDLSSQHLLDKLERLRNLLRGNPVDVGSRGIRPSDHPGALEFCTLRLAEKLVEQGETQVNVNPKAAFPIAAVIVELWSEFPAFGRLILANFYKRCPYLVPYYIPQQEGQSNEEYYKCLGYKHSGGKVEQISSYLKRTRGVNRLYAAIIITMPRRNQPHPHGLEQGWRYLAAMLNLAPLHAITAEMLVEFLMVAGYSLSREYGRQFQKLLHLVCTEYFTMIRNATIEDAGAGSATRLKDFLNESITKGGIPPPEGQLSRGFW
nr:EOG090X0755 [Macrothrix elegans]